MNNRALRLLLWSVPIMVLMGLSWRYFSPLGERTVHYDMGDISPFVQRLLPDDRVGEVMMRAGAAYVTLLDEPVYFSVTPPAGKFDELKLEVIFDPGGTPTFELGGLQDVAAQAFEFKPLANTLLEDSSWTRHDLADGLAIFSRDPESLAYQTFLETPPDRATVATYRATFPTPYRAASYVPLDTPQTFAVSLRGSHELLTYIKNENFGFDVMYTDVNRTYGIDEGSVKVFDEQGNLMTEMTFKDDGNLYDNQIPSAQTWLRLSGRGWPEGVYRLVLSGTSDIMWRTITTDQRYLVVKNRVFLGDDVGYLPSPRATSLFTNADRVTLETQHQEGLQTVSLGGASVAVEQVGGKYVGYVGGNGVSEIRSPVGDIKITGEGKYAFSRASFFDPDPLALTAFTSLEDTQIEHVLAYLAPIEHIGDWRVATATFATSQLAKEHGAYKFTLSAPGIHDDLGQVSIQAVNVSFINTDQNVMALMKDVKHFLKLLLP